jgi:hypothetical protein
VTSTVTATVTGSSLHPAATDGRTREFAEDITGFDPVASG